MRSFKDFIYSLNENELPFYNAEDDDYGMYNDVIYNGNKNNNGGVYKQSLDIRYVLLPSLKDYTNYKKEGKTHGLESHAIKHLEEFNDKKDSNNKPTDKPKDFSNDIKNAFKNYIADLQNTYSENSFNIKQHSDEYNNIFLYFSPLLYDTKGTKTIIDSNSFIKNNITSNKSYKYGTVIISNSNVKELNQVGGSSDASKATFLNSLDFINDYIYRKNTFYDKNGNLNKYETHTQSSRIRKYNDITAEFAPFDPNQANTKTLTYTDIFKIGNNDNNKSYAITKVITAFTEEDSFIEDILKKVKKDSNEESTFNTVIASYKEHYKKLYKDLFDILKRVTDEYEKYLKNTFHISYEDTNGNKTNLFNDTLFSTNGGVDLDKCATKDDVITTIKNASANTIFKTEYKEIQSNTKEKSFILFNLDTLQFVIYRHKNTKMYNGKMAVTQHPIKSTMKMNINDGDYVGDEFINLVSDNSEKTALYNGLQKDRNGNLVSKKDRNGDIYYPVSLSNDKGRRLNAIFNYLLLKSDDKRTIVNTNVLLAILSIICDHTLQKNATKQANTLQQQKPQQQKTPNNILTAYTNQLSNAVKKQDKNKINSIRTKMKSDKNVVQQDGKNLFAKYKLIY